MKAELISVGTELLLGNIVNTNASFLAEQCARLGLSVYYQSVVGDNKERLSETLKTALSRSDVVILTGGLGPTKDDLTKETVAEVLGRQLVEDAHSRKRIEAYFAGSRHRIIPDNNWKQAQIPEAAIAVDNENGTAPGIIAEHNGKTVIMLPGPPNEMIPMFTISIAPFLNRLQPEVIYSQTVKICGLGESLVETMIGDLIDGQSNPTVAPYAKTGEVHLRITAKAPDKESAFRLIEPVSAELAKRFGNHIYSTDDKETLEESIASLLKKKNLTIATAESCTGGLVSGRLVNVPGVSDVFKAGFVTYANEAKTEFLGVSEETLRAYGAVSEQTAEEMARGGASKAGCDLCISVTGIAGPDGGTDDKPVGLVYMGCFLNGKVTVRKFIFKGNRSKIRENAVVNALIFVRDCILEDIE